MIMIFSQCLLTVLVLVLVLVLLLLVCISLSLVMKFGIVLRVCNHEMQFYVYATTETCILAHSPGESR